MVILYDLRLQLLLLLLIKNLRLTLGSFSQFLHNLIVVNDNRAIVDPAFDYLTWRFVFIVYVLLLVYLLVIL
jgi:hypothetical protein